MRRLLFALFLAGLPAAALATPVTMPVVGQGGSVVQATGTVAVDSTGADATDTTNHALKVTCVTGCATGPTTVTSTPTAGTVTTALTFQTALSSSSTRKGCLIQNTSADTEYIYLGATGSATVGASLLLQSGASFQCANLAGGVATDNLAITSASLNGATFTELAQ